MRFPSRKRCREKRAVQASARMIEKLAQYKKILQEFPRGLRFCFAYGSGAYKQTTEPAVNMLDLIFVVNEPTEWHKENLRLNPQHYAQPLRFLGANTVAKVQETWGAKIYYNTLVKTAAGRLVKYGVVSEVSLVEDLLDWNDLYLAGRLHKPVRILVEPSENSQLTTALVQNLHSAVHAALLLLPEHFSETDFYKTIANLSYNGDFRMTFGENKDKVSNIVVPQLSHFRELYEPILKHFDNYLEMPKPAEPSKEACRQDTSPAARIHHLNRLPRQPQLVLVKTWLRGQRSRDTEDCLHAIAYDLEYGDILEQSLRKIVWRSSVSQSIKGILTAGMVKSLKYSGAKIRKMLQSESASKSLGPGELGKLLESKSGTKAAQKPE